MKGKGVLYGISAKDIFNRIGRFFQPESLKNARRTWKTGTVKYEGWGLSDNDLMKAYLKNQRVEPKTIGPLGVKIYLFVMFGAALGLIVKIVIG